MASAKNLGTAYIKIAPQMDGIQGAISRGLQNAVSAVTPSATALGTVISKAISAGMDAVSNSLDYAIQRVDTLNAFPKIMKNMGFSSEESEEAIKKLSSRIEGLPTTLDELVSYTQRLASTTGNLNKDIYNATNLAIAFNDAALAGGKGQLEANRAFEQFTQVISRGRPTMQDWKIMMEVMPGQLKQMAKYMGENNDSLKEYANRAGKTVDQLDGMDLYNWISADKNEHAKQRLEDLTKALVDLDNEGGAGITSFKDQVGDATHTIGNAMRLIPIRIGKAVASVVQEFGAGDIYNAIDKFTSAFGKIGTWVAKNVVPPLKNQVIPAVKNVLGAFKDGLSAVLKNQGAVDVLKNLLNTIIAYKAITMVETKLLALKVAAGGLFSNIGKGVAAFAEASKAGFSLSESFQYTALSTKGATSSLAGLGAAATSVAGIFTGVLTLAVLDFQAIMLMVERDQKKAETAARDYARAHYDSAQKIESENRALEIQKGLIQDLKDAQLEATNAEIAKIEAGKRAISYQDEMNQLIKEGKQDTDDYRLAELNYNKALAEQTKAEEDLAKAQDKVKNNRQQLDEVNMSSIYKSNLLNATTVRDSGAFLDLAANLDALKETTITYRDEYGNMVEANIQASKDMAIGIAEQLANSSSQQGAIWREIVDMANREGISFTEACAKYGKQAGQNVPGEFSKGFMSESFLITNSSEDALDKMKAAMNEKVKETYGIGIDIIEGIKKGIEDEGAQRSVFWKVKEFIKRVNEAMRQAAIINSPSKLTAEVGKYLDLGVKQGIDDYTKDVVASAEDMTERTMAAMSSTASVGQFQSGMGLTSGMGGPGGQVTQYNTFNVDSELDVKEVSKRLGWQVATAL